MKRWPLIWAPPTTLSSRSIATVLRSLLKSTVLVVRPLSPEPLRPPLYQPPRNVGGSRNGEPRERLIMPKILLVEDNEMNRDMLSRRLQRKGYSVISAHDGEQGHLLACSEMPDLILMDIRLPVMNRWEVSRVLQRNCWSVSRKTLWIWCCWTLKCRRSAALMHCKNCVTTTRPLSCRSSWSRQRRRATISSRLWT